MRRCRNANGSHFEPQNIHYAQQVSEFEVCLAQTQIADLIMGEIPLITPCFAYAIWRTA